MSETVDNLFSPSENDLESQTLPLEQVILNAIKARSLELHVCMPAKITKVINSSTVNIKPLFKRKYISLPEAIDLPELQSVMVAMYRGSDYSVSLPLAVGDTGLAIFCDRNIDNWSVSSGTETIDPADSRCHDLSDAIFIPGLYPLTNPTPGNGTDLIVTNGKAKLSIQKAGKFKLQNSSTELLDLLVQLLQALLSATVQTAIGPQPFTPGTIALLTQINNKLTTLKGT